MIVKCGTAAELLEHPELLALLPEYKLEGERLKGAEFLPERYYAMERAGVLQLFRAHNTAGELVGFASVICNTVPHYKMPIAVVESIFVSKGARRSGIGLDLIIAVQQFCETCAQCMYITAPVGGKLAKVLPRLGFTLSNLVFLKDFNVK